MSIINFILKITYDIQFIKNIFKKRKSPLFHGRRRHLDCFAGECYGIDTGTGPRRYDRKYPLREKRAGRGHGNLRRI